MKKTKVYRPRRGLRFSDDLGSARPTAAFIGDDSLGRTRPTKVKTNLQLRQFASVQMSGSVMSSVLATPDVYAEPSDPTILTSSLRIEGSVSMGRSFERKKLNATLLGLPQTSIDRAPWPSLTAVDPVLTGTFVSPSWTRANTGINQAFVQNALSSSYRHETIGLNLFYSGTQAVEKTPIPASASLFYSKESRLQTIVVKHTASFFDTVPRNVSGVFVPSLFAPGTGALFSVVTGILDPRLTGSSLANMSASSQTSSMYFPASILINVPVSGRLVDLKVWIECVHLSGGAGDVEPLGYFGAAIRNPNLSWGHAHPIRNDPNLIAVYQSPGTDYSALQIDDIALRMLYYPPHRFFQDTFLLWEPMLFYNLQHRLNGVADTDGGFTLSRYPVWERDRGIRTVFCDGAQVPNPRHLLAASVSGNYNGAPNVGAGLNPSAHGNNVPWTSDRTGLAVADPATYISNGSPPAGWLSGPGGANDVNEWPTTGVNYGATQIRPIYPFLDPLYQVKHVTDELPAQTGSATSQTQYQPALWRGFRPGLRGTEISGSWELLLIGQNSAGSGSWYFRQVRLEMTYETPGWSRFQRRSNTRRQSRRHGPLLLCSISGTDFDVVGIAPIYSRAAWDWWISDTYTSIDYRGEIGRTFGLRLNSGSFDPSSVSLIYRLTGALGDVFGPAPPWLTNNQFAMPAIPFSSATLSPPATGSDAIISAPIAPSKFISPSKFTGAQKLADVAVQVNPPRKLSVLAQKFVAEVILSGST